MTARYIVGDVFDVLASIEEGSVDVVMSSPPFLNLRSYLPDDHPDKAKEIGSETTPGEFIDTMIDVVEACALALADHGTLVFELGDTYAGSGGAGGDYAEDGWRSGQPAWDGSAASSRYPDRDSIPRPARAGRPKSPRPKYQNPEFDGGPLRDRAHDEGLGIIPARRRFKGVAAPGWPIDKSKALIPQLFAITLAYGFNPLTGRETEPWLVRNVVAWCRPNPPVGRDGDKFRPATSYVTIATKSARRYWDGLAVRVPGSENTHARTALGVESQPSTGKSAAPERGGQWHTLDTIHAGDGTRPMYDWWEIPTHPYPGAHFATYPPEVVVPIVKSCCPQKVCRTCGIPSARIVATRSTGQNLRKPGHPAGGTKQLGAVSSTDVPDYADQTTVGWTDCGHDDWRPGLLLDPFAGSGTSLAVATGHGREAIGIDLDERNAALALERVGPMFLTVEHLSTEGAA